MTDIHIYEAGDTMRGISGDFVTLEDYKKLEAQLEAVRPYIQHKRDCDIEAVHYAYEPECNCGLATLQGESNDKNSSK